MTKIVVTKELKMLPDQVERLNKLGDVKIYAKQAETYDEWLEWVKDADIICPGKFGLKQRYHKLKNKYISLPFVGTGYLDREILRENNIQVSNSPGANKVPVSEWIISMILNISRDLHNLMNVDHIDKLSTKISLKDKNITILGKGNVGSRVGKVCEALEMNVTYFRRGDNLIETVKVADYIIDCLGYNETTKGILNRDFFMSLKKGSFFITVTSEKIYDVDAMFEALDKDILAGVANDSGGIQVGDTEQEFYKRLKKHPKIIATPHIAWNTDEVARRGTDMMINNVEAWLKGEPINLIQ